MTNSTDGWFLFFCFRYALFQGQQAEAHGRAAAVGGVGAGEPAPDRRPDLGLGGEPGAAALRTVPPALLHGQSPARRTAQSQGAVSPKFSPAVPSRTEFYLVFLAASTTSSEQNTVLFPISSYFPLVSLGFT